jgi:inhibitor of cysteine peptidase
MKINRLVLVILALTFLLSACQNNSTDPVNSDQSVSSENTPAPTETLDPDQFKIGEITYLDNMDVVFLESFPLQVHSILKGNFPDGCTSIQSHNVERDGNIFNIKVFTKRPVNAFCTEALVPFEYIVPLEVYGLKAGQYSVKAYNISNEFSFTQDNIQPDKGACTLYPACGDK